MTHALCIARWAEHYENAESRKIRAGLPWVKMPTDRGSFGYAALVADSKRAAARLGCWTALLQVAARCPTRGLLVRAGEPLGPKELSMLTGLSAADFEEALPLLLRVRWLERIRLSAAEDGSPRPDEEVDTGAEPGGSRGKARESQGQTETESETETERKRESVPAASRRSRGEPLPAASAPSLPGIEPLSPDAVGRLWNSVAVPWGLRASAVPMPSQRARRLAGLLKRWPRIEEWRAAFEACASDPHWQGKGRPNPKASSGAPWRGNLDSFLVHHERFFEAAALEGSAPAEEANGKEGVERRRALLRDLAGVPDVAAAKRREFQTAGLKF